jgi:hypothetical protein
MAHRFSLRFASVVLVLAMSCVGAPAHAAGRLRAAIKRLFSGRKDQPGASQQKNEPTIAKPAAKAFKDMTPEEQKAQRAQWREFQMSMGSRINAVAREEAASERKESTPTTSPGHESVGTAVAKVAGKALLNGAAYALTKQTLGQGAANVVGAYLVGNEVGESLMKISQQRKNQPTAPAAKPKLTREQWYDRSGDY